LQLGDQLKAVDAIQAEPADVIHSRDIASDSLTSRIVHSTILLVEELPERTGNLILLRLKTIRRRRVDDAIGSAQAELVSEFREEEVETDCGFHGSVVFVLLFLYFDY